MLYLVLVLTIVAVALSAYTAFQSFVIRESIDQMLDSQETLRRQLAHEKNGIKATTNTVQAVGPEEFRVRGL